MAIETLLQLLRWMLTRRRRCRPIRAQTRPFVIPGKFLFEVGLGEGSVSVAGVAFRRCGLI